MLYNYKLEKGGYLVYININSKINKPALRKLHNILEMKRNTLNKAKENFG